MYRINEGPSPKIRWISFVGNELASDARLRSVIKTKMPTLWIFKGWLDYESIDRDVQVLTNYYKDLGYFRARVGREINYSGEGGWAGVTFVIDEGPRYKVRSVSFRGNERFSAGGLAGGLKLEAGDEFSKARLTRDRAKIVDQYGALGYIEADIEAEPRLLENEPELDLVYHIREGAVYRVARINVHISGDDPHTKITTALNRISLRPGEILDTRKLRASQRRLRAAGIFASNPAQGQVPRISYNLRTDVPAGVAYTELNPNYRTVAAPTTNVRGQSPDDSSLKPGEIIDIRKLRVRSRLLRTNIFAPNPAQGQVPTSYTLRTDVPAGVGHTELNPTHRTAAAPTANMRGQSPDDSGGKGSSWPALGPNSTQYRERQEGVW